MHIISLYSIYETPSSFLRTLRIYHRPPTFSLRYVLTPAFFPMNTYGITKMFVSYHYRFASKEYYIITFDKNVIPICEIIWFGVFTISVPVGTMTRLIHLSFLVWICGIY